MRCFNNATLTPLHDPMPALANIEHIWSTITEVDVQAIREQAHAPFRVALLGGDADVLHWLHDALRTDPFENVLYSLPETLWVYHLPGDEGLYESMSGFDLVLLVVSEGDVGANEQQAFSDLRRVNPQLPILIVQVSSFPVPGSAGSPSGYQSSPSVVLVNPTDADPFANGLTPRLLTLFPEQHVRLAHHLPGLRRGITQRLIKETSVANAGYSASTGIAELVPVLLIPLNVADVVILSKNQAIMSYKLALALGKDIRVQDMAVELAGVLGTGFHLAGGRPFPGGSGTRHRPCPQNRNCIRRYIRDWPGCVLLVRTPAKTHACADEGDV